MKKNKYKSCLVLIAHGSKDPLWCKPFERIVNKVKKGLPQNAVRLAYLELALPSISEVIKDLARENITDIKLLPLFMAIGSHVNRDIKELVLKTRRKLPNLKIKILPPIGKHPEVSSLICEIIKGYSNIDL